ncbi:MULTISPECIES: DUF3987 domain-containing protein [unclassified Candidatus Accumulibacter]|uniref:DUF3987 domain-containing protein n=1 Tax=unclassified Candidatus Accumulibacter TaxID=2619054 RepID=UPI0025C07D70|nr:MULTISPECIES: DUF3987 domain-containing protein [unclassified Candidatus Accumulibacter]
MNAPYPSSQADTTAILHALEAMFQADDVIEIRSFTKGRKRTDAGYFDGEHRQALAEHAARLNADGAAVYATLNAIDPQLLSRYANRIERGAAATTTDAQVIRRRWLLLDFDPARPTDTSATDAQLEAAKTVARTCYESLRADGWPDPLTAESGNGFHLLYPLDLPNDTESRDLVKGVLVALSARFDTDQVKVDQSVFNASRITKLYGTVATKGDNTPLAPWRLSRLVLTPKRGAAVTVDQLRACLAEPTVKPVALSAGDQRGIGQASAFDLGDFLERMGIATEQDIHEGSERFKLAHCPFNPAHGRGEAAIFRKASGALGFKCQHNSCAAKSWADVRALIDGPRELRQGTQVDFSGVMMQEQGGATESALSDDGRKLRGALAAIPVNAKSGKHSASNLIGMALRHSLSGIDEGEGAALCGEWDRLHGGASLAVFQKSNPDYSATQPLTIASVFDLARTHGWKDQQAAQDHSADAHRNAPKPNPTMLYGLVGDVGLAAAATTEANRYAAAAAHIALLSAGVGRNVFLPVGNVKHHARIFMLHVGRSGRGRKGEATALTKRIRGAIEKQHNEDSGNVADPLCGQMHDGGLSTREGLALLIHDGYKAGKEDVLAIEDKRLWVIESEFANVLHQAKRDGNTLSAALRDSWDGVSIRPATKTSRLWASHPHISLTGNITPSELLGLMESRELSNGFANRFLIFWAERERSEPFPLPTPRAVVTDLAERTKAAIRFATEGYPESKDSRPMELSADAKEEYARLYRGELSRTADGEKVAALIERRAPMLLRLAMLFALTDHTLTIEVQHIHAALAWVRFHRDSVRFIFNDAAGELAARESSAGAARILNYLQQNGQTSRAELSKKCFSGHLSAKLIDDALDSLLMNAPPSIEVLEGEKDEKSGKRTKFYHCCETGETGAVAHSARNLAGARSCETGEPGEIGIAAKNPIPPVSPSSQGCQSGGKLAGRPSSPISPSSHRAIATLVDLVEAEI